MENNNKISKSIVSLVAAAGLFYSLGCSKVEFAEVEKLDPQNSILAPGIIPKTVKSSEVVAYGNKQVDFLLVLDDSNSMMPELRKLATKMEAFVRSLDANRIEWQMCLTTTRGTVAPDGTLEYGKLLNWSQFSPRAGSSGKVLKSATENLNRIFQATVERLHIGGDTSGDERGTKAVYRNFASLEAQECYRPGAAVSVILISDEDVRSVGGNPANLKPNDAPEAYKPLEAEDYPLQLLAQAHRSFGADVRFTFSSIIVKPGDKECEALQDQETSPSHPGYLYEEIANLTDGGVGSICDSDYSSSLNNFKNKIVNSMSSLVLECAPLNGKIKVQIGGQIVPGVKLDGSTLKFASPLVEGTQIDLEYQCPQ